MDAVLGKSGVIGLVGAGAMGRGIAQVAAQAGFHVKLFDAAEGAAEQARAAVAAQFERLQQKGRMTQPTAEAALACIEPVASLPALAGAKIVIEAIVEKLDAKQALFRRLDSIVSRDAILATNTSSLSVTAIAAATAHPERVAGLHFFNPVPLMKVAEIVSGVLTAPRIAEELAAFVRQLGHTPVRAQDTPGFIVNHAGRGYTTEALRIAQECVADFRTIDVILREAAGFRLGPFELLDLTALDVSHPVMESIYHQYYEEPRYRPSIITAQRLAAGLLGRKSGRGFYTYDGKAQAAGAESSAQTISTLGDATAWDRPVWISAAEPVGHGQLARRLAQCGIDVETGAAPSARALCVVTPLGEDVTTRVLAEQLDSVRTVGIDTITDCAGRLTLMTNPATDRGLAQAFVARLVSGGVSVSEIEDSPGFVVQRVLATIVNIGCEIVQQGICSPGDLDRAVELGLGYPLGPLAWGDRLAAARVLTILKNMLRLTGDPRYRPSLWLARRARLGMSLAQR
jgi:3-hydroxybutyryl-CoA dehydrogenase